MSKSTCQCILVLNYLNYALVLVNKSYDWVIDYNSNNLIRSLPSHSAFCSREYEIIAVDCCFVMGEHFLQIIDPKHVTGARMSASYKIRVQTREIVRPKEVLMCFYYRCFPGDLCWFAWLWMMNDRDKWQVQYTFHYGQTLRESALADWNLKFRYDYPWPKKSCLRHFWASTN